MSELGMLQAGWRETAETPALRLQQESKGQAPATSRAPPTRSWSTTASSRAASRRTGGGRPSSRASETTTATTATPRHSWRSGCRHAGASGAFNALQDPIGVDSQFRSDMVTAERVQIDP